ncbi:MAG: hypothetical protein ACK51Y_00340, partial [Burkholderiales bacterium]
AWLTPEGLRLRTEYAQSLAARAQTLPTIEGLSQATRSALLAQPAQHRLALALASPDFSRY